MDIRPRRIRQNHIIREMTRETRMSPSSLILPLFIKEGSGIREEIKALPGHQYYSCDTAQYGVEKALNSGVNSVILFGLPNNKDEVGTSGWDENGVIQKAVRSIKAQYKNLQVITDVCMCEYTSHGHCGIIKDGKVQNDETLKYLAKIALSHIRAGADMVAPSDMMDGRANFIRKELDKEGFEESPIMVYSAKYASAFYGPFRDVAMSAPSFGDRKSYQMDYHNSREAVKEALLDIDEGADILMVKPALSYLDIIKEIKEKTSCPICAYSVSGEYAMIKAGALAGVIDEYKIMCETGASIYRAGADILISYYATQLAQAMKKGDIG